MRSDLKPSHLARLFHHLHLGALMRWLTLPGRCLKHEFSTALGLFPGGSATNRDKAGQPS